MEDVLMRTTVDDYDLTHTFSEGLYTRQVFIPEGHTVIGHKHKHKSLNILAQGQVILLDIITGEQVILTAPVVYESPANTRKIVYVLEDAVWINVHKTEETDLIKLEELFIDKNMDDLLEYNKKLIAEKE